MQLTEGLNFADRYTLMRLIGRGGFSEVWLAKDQWTHLQIALKVYAPGQGMDTDGQREFCSELANVYDLNHQNLLRPQHVDAWLGMPYLIMAYCSQGSCSARIGQMQEDEAWHFLHDVAAGLSYLHAKDVVHQDIKPGNILVNDAGSYLITDFGISTRARSTLRKSVVASAVSGGTMAYMGPERFSAQPAPTKASDIWALGATLYELLTGDVPFGELGGAMQKNGAEIPDIQTNVSDALKQVVYAMLATETWDRPVATTLVEWAADPKKIDVRGLKKKNKKKTTVDAPTSTPGDRPTTRKGDNGGDTGGTIPVSTPPPAPKKKGSKVWVWISLILLAVIGTTITVGVVQDKRKREQALVNSRDNCVEQFDNLNNVLTYKSDIDSWDRASKALSCICDCESDEDWSGKHKEYYEKRKALVQKGKDACKALSRIPNCSDNYYWAQQKINEINKIIKPYDY